MCLAIPAKIIDINGIILQGFSARAIDTALKKAGRSMSL